jgi:hypothetical protein
MKPVEAASDKDVRPTGFLVEKKITAEMIIICSRDENFFAV